MELPQEEAHDERGGEKKNCRCAAGEMGKTQANLVLAVTFGQETGPLTFIHSQVVACLLIPFAFVKRGHGHGA